MFKPVTGDALSNFDPETIEFFRKRESDEQTTLALMQAPRRARHHLPIYIDKDKNPTVSMWESQHNQFWWKILLGGAFFCKRENDFDISIGFAANEFSKIYYPYGIILRRSIPISWATYIRQRAPISLFFLMAW